MQAYTTIYAYVYAHLWYIFSGFETRKVNKTSSRGRDYFIEFIAFDTIAFIYASLY